MIINSRGTTLRRALLAAATVALAALDPGQVAAADRPDLAAACFPAAALASRPEERAIARHTGIRDTGPPSAGTTALAPAPRGAIRRVALPAGRKLAALTFDFCEQPGEIAGYDGAIVDYLRTNRIRATLFMGGRWLTTHPERTQQLLADPLFEIASHGWAHRNTRLLSGPDLLREITGPSRAYSAARASFARSACIATKPAALTSVPAEITLFRFPYGACSPAGLDAVAANGLRPIQWDVSTGDPWPGQSAAAIANVMVRQTRPGSIILAHANGRGVHTAEALPIAIPRLKAMGYTFVTVSELLTAGRPDVVDSCYDAKPGDTDKYDRLPFARKPVAGTTRESWRTAITGAEPARKPTGKPADAVQR